MLQAGRIDDYLTAGVVMQHLSSLHLYSILSETFYLVVDSNSERVKIVVNR